MQEHTVAIIGAGVMGEAIIKGLLYQQLLPAHAIIAADPRPEQLAHLEHSYGVRGDSDNVAATRAADWLVLAIKPQVADKVLAQLQGSAGHIQAVLSIVAGLPLLELARQLGNERIVRCMPNTPGQIGQGITVWTASAAVNAAQRELARTLLSALGEQIVVEDERFLDMATALSGSGPAYVFLFMEAMIDAGVHMGFSRRDAQKLVTQTLLGSVLYAQQSGLHPAELRNQVTSPGGTTAAALEAMERRGLRTVLSDGVWAAYRRSQELGE